MYSASAMSSVILAFSYSSLAWEDWDFLELPGDLLHLDSLLLQDPFYDLLSVSALLNQLWIFLLKVQTLLYKSSNQSSSPALSSSSSTWLYSSWMFSKILNRSSNWASSSYTAILFLFERRRSLIMLLSLIILPLIFSLLSFNNVALYALPFSVSFLLLVETSLTSFSSAWSLFDQVWSPSMLAVSLLLQFHQLDSPSVWWSISVAAFTSRSDIFFTRFTILSPLYTIFDVAALQGFQ